MSQMLAGLILSPEAWQNARTRPSQRNDIRTLITPLTVRLRQRPRPAPSRAGRSHDLVPGPPTAGRHPSRQVEPASDREPAVGARRGDRRAAGPALRSTGGRRVRRNGRAGGKFLGSAARTVRPDRPRTPLSRRP